ncbi:MAG: glycoside hydrolase family 172 protein [Bacteroidota bacterium]
MRILRIPKIIILSCAAFAAGLLVGCTGYQSPGNHLYSMPDGTQTRWQSFENSTGEKGKGGMENKGAKGHPYDRVYAGESVVLLDVKGSGVVHRIWATISEQDPEMLRGLRLDMYWDGAEKPAVSVPFGDFFGVGLGAMPANETEFFSNPEGRSFNASVPMPFATSAKIVLTNELERDLYRIFYDINYTLTPDRDELALYFHAYWNRELATQPGKDFEILPYVEGTGRYLGCNMGVNGNTEAYAKSWWGEGEVKMYMDGDTEYPTLIGTGTEDYIGTAWGQGEFNHRYQGCLIADTIKNQWAFYRYHVKDPVFFYRDFRATIQQMGGWNKKDVQSYMEHGADLIPVTTQAENDSANILVHMVEKGIPIDDPGLIDGWTNFYRSDDVSATAYFYLDRPESNLPALEDVKLRTANLF